MAEYVVCGRKGCLEAYCSATGVARSAKEIVTKATQETDCIKQNTC